MKIIHRDLKPENILIINKDEDDDDLLYIIYPIYYINIWILFHSFYIYFFLS